MREAEVVSGGAPDRGARPWTQLRARRPLALLTGLALSAVLAVTVVMHMISTTGVRTVPVNYFARISCEPDKPFVLVARDASGAVVGTSTISGTFSESMQFCLVRGTMELRSNGPITVTVALAESPERTQTLPPYSAGQVADRHFWIGANPSSQGPPGTHPK